MSVRKSPAWQCDRCAEIVRADTYGLKEISKLEADAQTESCTGAGVDRDKAWVGYKHIWMPIIDEEDTWLDLRNEELRGVYREPLYKPGVKYVPKFQDPVKTSKLSQEKLREYMVEIMKLAKNMGATVLVDSFGSQVQEQKPKPKPEAPKLRRFNWEDA